MTKLIDSTGEIFMEGKTIQEIIKKLNDDQNGSNEWRYYYRPSDGVVNAYFDTDSGESDTCGEKADVIYDVIND